MYKIISTFFFLSCSAFLFGCLFRAEEKVMSEYGLKNGNTIQLVYYNGGATAPMGIRVKKKNSHTVFQDLPGFDYTYLVSFDQLNDTLLKITLTDTSYFKGRKTYHIINLNKRINLK